MKLSLGYQFLYFLFKETNFTEEGRWDGGLLAILELKV